MEKTTSDLTQRLNLLFRKPPENGSPGLLPSIGEIAARESKLAVVKKDLKSQFAGLDEQIEQIFAYARPWYLLPEAQRRPTVISLWGMTGVGKSSFVRAFVSSLKMNTKYCEIDVRKVAGQSQAHTDWLALPARLNELSETSCVLLLDELHNVRTINSSGEELDRPALADFWPLLDDGSLLQPQGQATSYLYYLRNEIRMRQRDSQNTNVNLDDGMLTFLVDYLGLNCAIDELAALFEEDNQVFLRWAVEKTQHAVQEAKRLDFSKALVFVASNLDEAFAGALQVNPDDLNADDLYEITRTVSADTIKECLLARFRPEQVARLGSMQVIFPSLSKAAFNKLIDVRLKELASWVEASFQVKLTFESTLVELIMREGAVPSQGARPVLSTINEMVESRIPTWLIDLKQRASTQVEIGFDFAKKLLYVRDHASQKVLSEEQLTMRQDRLPVIDLNESYRRVVAAHEAGHAVVGITKDGRLPLKILAGTVAVHRGGPRVVFSASKLITKAYALSQLALSMAGIAAEELTFGADNVSLGASADLQKATEIAGTLVCQAGLGNHLGVSFESQMAPFNVTSFKERDDALIEELLQAARKEAFKVLNEQQKLFISIYEELLKRDRLSRTDIEVLVKLHYRGSAAEISAILAREEPISTEILASPSFLKKVG